MLHWPARTYSPTEFRIDSEPNQGLAGAPDERPFRRGRRAWLGGACAALAAPLWSGCAGLADPVRPADAPLDLDTVAGRARAFLAMRGALDDRIVVGSLAGTYNGVVDEVVEPLFGLVSATFSRYRRLPDGGFAILSFEQAYYTTLDHARVLDEWVNPYTGRTVGVPVWVGEPLVQRVSAALVFGPTRPLDGARFSHTAALEHARRDDVTFTERLSTGAVRDGRYRGYSELVTIRAPIAAFAARDAAQVPSTTSYSSVVSWRPWLGMGTRPGHLMAHGTGTCGIDAALLPPVFVDETRRRRPEVFDDPAGILAPALRLLDAPGAQRG